jgi:3-hydroxybutyryl-CoA dehydrogenase
MNIQTVGVIGAGTMGNGIAQVFAQAGYTVRLQDVVGTALDRARAGIGKSLGTFV